MPPSLEPSSIGAESEEESSSKPKELDIRNLPVSEACDRIISACRDLHPGESLHISGPIPPALIEETLEDWEGLDLHMLTKNPDRKHLLISRTS